MENQQSENSNGSKALLAAAVIGIGIGGTILGSLAYRIVNNCRCPSCQRTKLSQHRCSMCAESACKDCCRYSPNVKYRGETIAQGYTCSLECREKQKAKIHEQKSDIDAEIALAEKAQHVQLYPRSYRGKSGSNPEFNEPIWSDWHYEQCEAEESLQWQAAKRGAKKVCFIKMERRHVDPRIHGQSSEFRATGFI